LGQHVFLPKLKIRYKPQVLLGYFETDKQLESFAGHKYIHATFYGNLDDFGTWYGVVISANRKYSGVFKIREQPKNPGVYCFRMRLEGLGFLTYHTKPTDFFKPDQGIKFCFCEIIEHRRKSKLDRQIH
jgi:hypothetical protein